MLTRRSSLVVVAVLAFSWTVVQAAKPKNQASELQQQNERVSKILRAESMGSKLDRQQHLESMLAGENVADEVFWQAGYVRQGERWVRHDAISFTSEAQKLLQEYARYREQHWGNDEEHLQIAQWCMDKGLPEQARAHLMAVTLNHPDNRQLRTMLGYQTVAGDWMNAEEFASVQRHYARQMNDLKQWGPEITRIRDGFSSGNPLRMQQAQTALSKLTNADAVPALDLILLPYSQLCAEKCVQQLALINHRSATLSLCRTALNCPWNNVSEQALTELKHRPLEDYVPTLLSGTRTNHSVELEMYWNDPPLTARGYMTLSSVTTSSESFTKISRQVQRLGLTFNPIPINNTAVDNIPRVFQNASSFSELAHHFQNEINSDESTGDRALSIATTLDATVESLKLSETQERLDRDYNDRVVACLNRIVPDREFSSVESVWSWWNETMELGVDRNQLATVTEISEDSVGEFSFEIASCFTAGTPVWSEFGSRPIESLKIGDRVLTKHVETGELTYRPIIRTTYRETNQPLIRIRMGEENITATGGHLFWVSGSGWIKARDLKPGHRVHTPTGTVEVAGVEEAATEPTYNLVVDGFHTYFVGEGKALCHDVSLASPTDAVVPGLVD